MKVICPQKGDIVLVNLSPVFGHEQKGNRPHLVITKEIFNREKDVCWVVPITSKNKGYPFEVILSAQNTKGVILSDQIRSIDWNARKVKKVDSVSEHCLNEVINKIKLILS